MRRLGQAGLLAGAGLLLAGLYTAWLEPRLVGYAKPFGGVGGPLVGLQNLFNGRSLPSAWDPHLAVFALLCALLGLVALVRPERTEQLPLGFAALGATFFTLADLVQQRDSVHTLNHVDGLHARPTAGFVLPAVALASMLLSVWVLRRDHLRAVPPLAWMVVPSIAAALLIALLLPSERYFDPEAGGAIRGVDDATGFGLAVLALVVVTGAWTAGLSPRVSRLLFPVATAVLAVAKWASVPPGYVRAYGVWVGLGLAVALIVAALVFADAWPLDLDRARVWPFVVLAGAAILLFLPWQHGCYPATGLGRLSGQCVTIRGWSDPNLAVVLVLFGWAVGAGRPRVSRVEAAVAAALLVSTVGFELSPVHGGAGGELAWGAVLAYVVTGLLVLPVMVAASVRAFSSRRLDLRLVPLVVCASYLAAVVVPSWDVFSYRIDDALQLRGFSWLMIPCALAAIRLARLWWERAPVDGAGWLTFLPLFLFTVAAANAVAEHQAGRPASWGEGVVLSLAAVLTLVGWIEEHGGLASFEVPEILRIDRI